MKPSVECLRPDQILALVRGSGVALIPVSPLLEWHSWHLPLGVDGLLVEHLASELAERLDAAWFRVLSLGLDEQRDEAFKQSQGLPVEADVFGMNYPTLPLPSEYVEADDLRHLLGARLRMARTAGFRHLFVLNHHGGAGQVETLREIARTHENDRCKIAVLHTMEHDTFTPQGEAGLPLRVGGHAGLAETHQFMAFFPDAPALDRLPEGDLRAAETGILHDQPVIPARFSPRRAQAPLAAAWGAALLDNLERAIRSATTRAD